MSRTVARKPGTVQVKRIGIGSGIKRPFLQKYSHTPDKTYLRQSQIQQYREQEIRLVICDVNTASRVVVLTSSSPLFLLSTNIHAGPGRGTIFGNFTVWLISDHWAREVTFSCPAGIHTSNVDAILVTHRRIGRGSPSTIYDVIYTPVLNAVRLIRISNGLSTIYACKAS